MQENVPNQAKKWRKALSTATHNEVKPVIVTKRKKKTCSGKGNESYICGMWPCLSIVAYQFRVRIHDLENQLHVVYFTEQAAEQ